MRCVLCVWSKKHLSSLSSFVLDKEQGEIKVPYTQYYLIHRERAQKKRQQKKEKKKNEQKFYQQHGSPFSLSLSL